MNNARSENHALTTYTVLYADDEPGLLDLGKIFLENTGEFRVDTVTSVTGALSLLGTKSYDAIISDYQMPVRDGIEFLRIMRASGNETPFILFTGKGREEIGIGSLNEGTDLYLQKGGNPEAQFAELVHKVRIAVQRRRAIIALEESEHRYRNVVEIQTEFISRFLPDGTHVFVNDAYCRYFEKQREEIIGHQFVSHIHPKDQKKVSQHFAALTPRNPSGEIENRIVKGDGTVRWQWWSNHAIFDHEGRVVEYQSVGKDITDRKHACVRYTNAPGDWKENCKYGNSPEDRDPSRGCSSPAVYPDEVNRMTLLKKTRSLCPACGLILDADVIQDGGQIWLERMCPSHGVSRHLYWNDAALYHRFEKYDSVGNGIENPKKNASSGKCPGSCGLCNSHRSQTLLANIDLTNRCNLNCDFCFANARACGFVYEPDFDEIVGMMQMLRNQKPVPTPAVQFSGGEPTMRDDLVDIVRKAKELGFPQIQIATNGVKLANNPALAQDLRDAGLSTIYLHFDGVTSRTNPLLKIHRRALENLTKAGLGVVLVPTIIKGRNDQEVGKILKFATDHITIVRGVNFQPVAFTGAAKDEDIEKERITIPELIGDIEIQTDGILKKSDFYPIPCVLPFSDLVKASTGQPPVRFTAHEHCGAATYVFVTRNGMTPVTRMVDVESLLVAIEQMANKLKKGGIINKYTTLLESIKEFHGSFREGETGSKARFWKLIVKMLVNQNFDALREFHVNALFIGTMHFMDRYNYDIGRVQRCCIHYATPDGRLIPFCTYNSGPVYREQVWKKYAKAPDRGTS